MIGWALNLEFYETYEVSLGAYLSCQIMANVLIHQPTKNYSLFSSYNNTRKYIVEVFFLLKINVPLNFRGLKSVGHKKNAIN